jgi:hypothetical protein
MLEPVYHMMRLRRTGRLVAPARPAAPLIPGDNGLPDPPRDVIHIPHIQRQRPAVQRGPGQQVPPQVRGQPGFTGQQLDAAADELAHQLPHPCRVRVPVLQPPRRLITTAGPRRVLPAAGDRRVPRGQPALRAALLFLSCFRVVLV